MDVTGTVSRDSSPLFLQKRTQLFPDKYPKTIWNLASNSTKYSKSKHHGTLDEKTRAEKFSDFLAWTLGTSMYPDVHMSAFIAYCTVYSVSMTVLGAVRYKYICLWVYSTPIYHGFQLVQSQMFPNPTLGQRISNKIQTQYTGFRLSSVHIKV